jgi:hypothetical protein
MKIVFPAFWISLWGVGTLMMFLGRLEGTGETLKWVFLFVWMVGSAFIYWSCVGFKKVNIDGDFLYVSNYIKKISIPLSEIQDVTEIVWLNIHPVTIHLKSPTEFGDKIVFMPRVRVFAFFSSHPVVAELKELAVRNPAGKFTR